MNREHEKEFLIQYGKADDPNMDDSIVELLMDDHFYYIDSEFVLDGGGYFIKSDISNLDEIDTHIHNTFKSLSE